MRRNVAFNGVDAASCRPSNVENPNVSEKERERLEREWEGKVRVNEGDAWWVARRLTALSSLRRSFGSVEIDRERWETMRGHH
jgi:hypothetical protein